MNVRLQLYPTMVTPFAKDLSVDFASVARLIRHYAACGCDGVFAVCQSSEMFFLTDDEKIELAAFCIRECRTLGLKCVASGHTQEDLPAQIAYLQRLELLEPDAVILVSNRLAGEDEQDSTAIANLELVLKDLRPGTRLGIYECPYPYKRLLTPEIISFMIKSGRFDFLKDTSCQIEVIRNRLRQMDGSTLRLYNANAATLLDSYSAGATGYSGVMLNFIPELFSRLKTYSSDYEWPTGVSRPFDKGIAEALADCISLMSVVEYQNYPVNAKYVLQQKGIMKTLLTRNGKPPLTESQYREMNAFMNHAEMEYARLDGVCAETKNTHSTRCDAEKNRSSRNASSSRQTLFSDGAFFRSCHASTVLPLDDGTVLAAYFAGNREGSPDTGIWLSRRIGGVWQNPACIAKISMTAHWNPVLFRSGSGIRLVFKTGVDVPSWQSWTQYSGDQGATWSETAGCDGIHAAAGPVRSKPVVLSNGRLLAPNSIETADEWRPCVDVSDDGGTHFNRLAMIPVNSSNPSAPGYLEGLGAIQPTLWESMPGNVHALLRTTCGRIFRSDSSDGGHSWCMAYDAGLPNNNSGIDVERQAGDLYLVMNPVSGNWGRRNPLVIKKSTDNGLGFQPFATLENAEIDIRTGASAEFSYPAVAIHHGRLHVTYTCNRRQIAYCALDLGSVNADER